MGSLQLKNIQKSFGAVEVLKSIDLSVEDGEFVVFVGPSGCGKSTLLRVIAGLEDATGGTVEIDGEVVNAKSSSQRGIAMVFQTYALYPHLTVRDNMRLGLRQARTPKNVIDERVDIASKMLSLEDYLDRRPAELSGGQRQRVAIGRAVVREPKLFLFDEPLSNLDAALRVNTRLEIAKLHRDLATTMIYVTHDQVEAMTMADRIVILNGGKIEQVGSPMDLYNHPANKFVAGFIGSPKMNFFDAAKLSIANASTVGVRPEHITIVENGGDIQGIVSHVEHLGSDTNVYLDCGELGLVCIRLFGQYEISVDSNVAAKFATEHVHRFDGDDKAIE